MKKISVSASCAGCILALILILFAVGHPLPAQTQKIDFYKRALSQPGKKDSLSLVLNLLMEKNSMPGDSIRKYVEMAESLAGSSAGPEQKFLLNFYKAIIAQNEGSLDWAVSYCDSNIKAIQAELSDVTLLLRFLQLKASLLVRKGLYEEGIKAYFKVLDEAEKSGNVEYRIAGKNGIGWIYMEKSEFRPAIDWFLKALATTTDQEVLDKFTIVMTNVAATYNSMHQNDSALEYVNRAIAIALRTEDLRSVANGYAIKADILIDLGRKEEAALALREALNVRKKIGDVYYIVSDIYQMGLFYASNGDCNNGILICKEGIDLVNQYQLDSKKLILYEALSLNYKVCGDFKSYADILEKIIAWKDSAAKAVSESALAEMSAKYNLEAKEQQILRQDLLLSRRNYIIYGSLVLFLLIGIIGLQYFFQYKIKQERKSLMDMKRVRDDERLRIAADLHDNIGSQLGFISRKIEIALNRDTRDEHDRANFLHDMDVSVRKIISDLRETIWTMKKEKIDFRELSDRLKYFAQQQLSGSPGIKLHITEHHDKEVSFTSTESINIYRIVQEALSNAFSHSGAGNIVINFISAATEGWRIEIIDDGRGFQSDRIYVEHYGIENMKQRAENIHIFLEIKSVAAKGTTVVVSERKIV